MGGLAAVGVEDDAPRGPIRQGRENVEKRKKRGRVVGDASLHPASWHYSVEEEEAVEVAN